MMDFPALKHITYLNTPSSGLMSQGLSEWRAQHDSEFLQQGSAFRARQESEDLIGSAKAALARLFKGEARNTYLVPNFSLAFNALLDALPSQASYLLLEDEYPSISYPIASRNRSYTTLIPDARLNERLSETFNHAAPDVLVFSIVQYTSGLKIDLDFIRKLKQQYSQVLIIADGTQYCGTREFDFAASGIDVLICSGYKWMLAGYGNGFVMTSPAAERRIEAAFSPAEKPTLPHLQGKSAAGFIFEPGHQDTLAAGSMKYAAEWFLAHDYPALCQQLKTLTDRAFSELARRDLLLPALQELPRPSTIFSLPVLAELEDRLHQAGIVCVQRGGRIRVGFHIYNNRQDLDLLLAVIDTCL